MQNSHTLAELESLLGERLRNLRLGRNIDQKTLAARAGISVRALQKLEAGDGSNLTTLLSVVRALDREDWLLLVAPTASINPMTMVRSRSPRQRATSLRAPKTTPK
ncbi:MAG: helix-turn-helix transcriptional regulator [Azonexus sp.]|nr:helix-turn-helix transcriptional regulator [Azonexus sp.]